MKIVRMGAHNTLGRRRVFLWVLLACVVASSALAAAASAKKILQYTGNGALVVGYSKFALAAGRPLDPSEAFPADLSDNACILLSANGVPIPGGDGAPQLFSAGQKAALKAYMQAGGTVIAMTENYGYPGAPPATAAMNDLAGYTGVNIRAGFASIDPDYHSTSVIGTSPYTAGVSTIGFAFTNSLSLTPPAKTLVSTSDGTPFIGVQEVGLGKFVYSGDTNIFSDTIGAPYVIDSNTRFVKNLCGDNLPPTITIVTPASGARYKKDAAINANWSCVDLDGDVDTQSFSNGGLAGTVSGLPIDTSVANGQVVTKSFAVDCADKAGNVAPTKTHQYVVDDRPPTITITVPDAGPYARGAQVAASWTCTDPDNDVATQGYVNGALSGGTSGGAIDTSTKGQKSYTVTCTDLVGNSATQTVLYDVSNSPPVPTITNPGAGARFKPGALVNASWLCTDPDGPADLAAQEFTNGTSTGTLSGLPLDTIVAGPSSVSKAFTVTCTDVEAATGTKTVNYVVDPSPPTVTIAVPLDGGVYERGSSVPASWGCQDEDGPADIDPNPAKTFGTVAVGELINTTGVGTKSFSVTCADRVGNTASKTVQYTVIDASPPVVTITVPRNGATYTQGQVLAPSYACTDPDGVTDIRSCVRVGGTGPVDTSQVGTFPFTVNGEDLAGNKASATVRYTVVAKAGAPAAGAAPVKSTGSPAAKVCKSRRQFRIRVKKLKGGVTAVSATVFVNGKKTLTRRGKRVTAIVTLKGLKKGRYTVKINVKYSNGRTLSYTRRFKTCTPKGK